MIEVCISTMLMAHIIAFIIAADLRRREQRNKVIRDYMEAVERLRKTCENFKTLLS